MGDHKLIENMSEQKDSVAPDIFYMYPRYLYYIYRAMGAYIEVYSFIINYP